MSSPPPFSPTPAEEFPPNTDRRLHASLAAVPFCGRVDGVGRGQPRLHRLDRSQPVAGGIAISAPPALRGRSCCGGSLRTPVRHLHQLGDLERHQLGAAERTGEALRPAAPGRACRSACRGRRRSRSTGFTRRLDLAGLASTRASTPRLLRAASLTDAICATQRRMVCSLRWQKKLDRHVAVAIMAS